MPGLPPSLSQGAIRVDAGRLPMVTWRLGLEKIHILGVDWSLHPGGAGANTPALVRAGAAGCGTGLGRALRSPVLSCEADRVPGGSAELVAWAALLLTLSQAPGACAQALARDLFSSRLDERQVYALVSSLDEPTFDELKRAMPARGAVSVAGALVRASVDFAAFEQNRERFLRDLGVEEGRDFSRSDLEVRTSLVGYHHTSDCVQQSLTAPGFVAWIESEEEEVLYVRVAYRGADRARLEFRVEGGALEGRIPDHVESGALFNAITVRRARPARAGAVQDTVIAVEVEGHAPKVLRSRWLFQKGEAGTLRIRAGGLASASGGTAAAHALGTGAVLQTLSARRGTHVLFAVPAGASGATVEWQGDAGLSTARVGTSSADGRLRLAGAAAVGDATVYRYELR